MVIDDRHRQRELWQEIDLCDGRDQRAVSTSNCCGYRHMTKLSAWAVERQEKKKALRSRAEGAWVFAVALFIGTRHRAESSGERVRQEKPMQQRNTVGTGAGEAMLWGDVSWKWWRRWGTYIKTGRATSGSAVPRRGLEENNPSSSLPSFSISGSGEAEGMNSGMWRREWRTYISGELGTFKPIG
jgi:hypothetical protein